MPYGVGSGAEFVVGAEAQLQLSVAELTPAGKMAVVGSAVVGPDCELGETVDGAATEKLVVPEAAGLQKHQAVANTEPEKPLEQKDYIPQEWEQGVQGWMQI